MIEHVDRAVERFFRTRAPLEESAVAVSFDTPDREWSAARSRPTVDVFLWDVGRSPKALRAGMEQRVDDAGARQRRPMTPVVDLHYVVSAWASEPRDEHQLLGSLLECVLAHPRLPEDVLDGPLAGVRCGLDLAPPGTRVPGELWGSFAGGPRPVLHVAVNLPFEVFRWREVARLADTVEVGVTPRRLVPAGSAASPGSAEPGRSAGLDGGAPALVRRRRDGAVVMEGKPGRDNASRS